MPSSRSRPFRALSVASLGVLVLASGCKPKTETPAQTSTQPPAANTAPSGVNDAQIAHIAVTANSIDSALGELAKRKARGAAVKAFAQTMITDHGAVNKQAVQLAGRLNVTPEPNDVSRRLQQGADTTRSDLEKKNGAAFDQAYIAREVQYHQAVLDALDQTLIPGAQNAELKTLLQNVRPAIAAHLARAKQLQGTVGNR
jgi:putative membrane protein